MRISWLRQSLAWFKSSGRSNVPGTGVSESPVGFVKRQAKLLPSSGRGVRQIFLNARASRHTRAPAPGVVNRRPISSV